MGHGKVLLSICQPLTLYVAPLLIFYTGEAGV